MPDLIRSSCDLGSIVFSAMFLTPDVPHTILRTQTALRAVLLRLPPYIPPLLRHGHESHDDRS